MFPKVLADFFSKEFYKFLVVGGFAAVVNFFSRIGINYFFGFTLSVIIAYLIGMITAFILNKILVFKIEKGNTAKQFWYFTLVNIFAVIQTVTISVFLAKWFFPRIGFMIYSEEIAHFIGISIPVITSFLGHKYISFRK
jgi:putative flippase GtrA